MVTPQKVFPLLKNKSWADERGLDSMPFSSSDKSEGGSPVIVIAIDDDASLAYLPKDVSSETKEPLYGQAYVNLSKKIAPLTWRPLDFSDQAPGLRVLALGGDFYASEAILIDDKVEEAHKLLGAEKLLMCRPVRGQLLALALDHSDELTVKTFLAACASHYLEAQSREDQRALDSTAWLLERGQPPKPYKDFLQQDTPEASPPESKLYTPAQIGIASFFGTALAGFYMLHANYQGMGQKRSAKWVGVTAVLVLPLLVLAVLLTPDSNYDRLLPAVCGLVMGFAANGLQGSVIQHSIQNRSARKRSFWQAFLVMVISLLVVLVLLVGVLATGWVPSNQ